MSSYKDLGVNTASDLTWTKLVGETVHKANKVLGLLKRTVGSKNNEIFFNFLQDPRSTYLGIR